MTPQEIYQTDLAEGRIKFSEMQSEVLHILEQQYHQLITRHKSHLAVLKIKRHKPHMKGLYLWGDVGIGKTYLMDIFFQSLPFTQKRRLHFHEFMLEVHQKLRELQGKADPLLILTKNLSKEIYVLCLDEFMVVDIADAMLLAGLLEGLINQGVYLVITSNTKPDDLYRNGLQRARFLPAISLMKNHLEIVHLQSEVDYRLQEFEKKGVYFYPLDDNSQQALENYFRHFSLHENIHTDPIIISDRQINIMKRSHNIIWFSFDVLCHSPRSQADYIEIANNYHLVILSGVAALSDTLLSQVNYFIKLVDVFYDRGIKLIISAQVPIEQLYQDGHFQHEFQRTRSRLIEMQSKKYWMSS